MPFFSAILQSKIKDLSEKVSGRITDILIDTGEATEFPPLAGIVVENKKREKSFIPTSMIESFGSKEIELNKKFEEALTVLPSAPNLVSIKQYILDKQIVDLTGLRVVRVNDLQFGRVQKIMCLIAIDISNRGLLRRLGWQSLAADKIFWPHLLEWKNIQLVENKLRLDTNIKELIKLHPADLANIIEKMNVYQGSTLLQSLDHDTAARVLEEIQPDIKKMLVKNLGAARAAELMNKMSVDELVDLIQLLPGRESREIINKLPLDSKTQKVKKILEYDEDTAGGLMTTEYFWAHPESTVEEVVNQVRKNSRQHRSLLFVYIVNQENKFLGVVSLRNLIVSEKTKTMQEIMKKPRKLPTLKVNDELMSVAALMTKYNLMSVAVLDKEKKLLGVVTADDIMRRLIPEA